MEWTTEPPTQEGWYWVIDEDGEIDLVQVSRVDHGAGDRPLEVLACDDTELLSEYSHWLGPLPVPVPPMKGE